MTWTKDQRDDATKRATTGGTLSSHEEGKLREAARQAGSAGSAARSALDKYDKK